MLSSKDINKSNTLAKLINSIQNKLALPFPTVLGHVNVLSVNETKIDSSFPDSERWLCKSIQGRHKQSKGWFFALREEIPSLWGFLSS